LADDDAPMATLATPIADAHELFDPNVVKLVRATNGRALYFSRAPLPWARDAFATNRDVLPQNLPFLRHIGIYAYRAGFLQQYAKLTRTPLEQAESLEQLRVLECGYAIATRLTPEPFPPGIDTEADIQRAEGWLGSQS
jgi:3-deoxy-manno-octulosonate cytidylyltransferase (CMP-KDO synthetase)